ncbi:MAG: hypothetical protein CM1200mP3_04290 [Chloroflexota bacterium]|nr:MAG: hypothetical protein CM1200mP3_04290 [Chloroflexota bacterium]
MAMTKEELLEAFKELPVIELAGLVKDLEGEILGVSAAAAAPVAVAPVPGAAVGGTLVLEHEEKSDFTVNLKEIGPNK